MKAPRQRVMSCPCGNAKVLALGMCATCYTLKRQDEESFGGLRELVLERDGYRCRVCNASGRDKRSIVVHHRKPGKSVLNLMLSLCPGCHSKIHRTKAALSLMPPLLLELWREQHPKAHEQVQLDFRPNRPRDRVVPLVEKSLPHPRRGGSVYAGAHHRQPRQPVSVYRSKPLRQPTSSDAARIASTRNPTCYPPSTLWHGYRQTPTCRFASSTHRWSITYRHG
jgi:hypothetical protein